MSETRCKELHDTARTAARFYRIIFRWFVRSHFSCSCRGYNSTGPGPRKRSIRGVSRFRSNLAGRIGSGQFDPTRPVNFKNLLTRADPTREISKKLFTRSDPTRPDPTREIFLTIRPDLTRENLARSDPTPPRLRMTRETQAMSRVGSP